MSEKIVRANGVELCVETFGDPADPAIVLIMGQAASMDWWEDEFCQRLADGRRFVIRYDQRDTGRSVTYEPGAPKYTGADLVADAAGLIESLGLTSAHVAGISAGGGVAQFLALDYPDRVATLTLISTTHAPGAPDLPSMADELRVHYENAPAPPDWSDRDAVIDYVVEDARPLAARSQPFDETATRELAVRVVNRSVNMASTMTNHMLIEGGEPWRQRMAGLGAPTLVIHGTEDPLFPVEHGRALADEIPGAQLLTIEGMGHEFPPRVWGTVIPALLNHTSGGWGQQANRLAAESVRGGDPTGWFEQLYSAADAGEVPMPWDRGQPWPSLVEWAGERGLAGDGKRALVIGCGLGEEAEYVAGLGFDTTAFDVSETAIEIARRRTPGTAVNYLTADLLDPPASWRHSFDLVVEIYTVQAVPRSLREQMIAAVRDMAAPGGTIIVVAAALGEGEDPDEGPPWPLSRAEVESFAADGLAPVTITEIPYPGDPDSRQWRAEFHRPAEPS